MNKIYINYSDDLFKKKQLFSLKMARYFGRFDQVIGYSRNDIDDVFFEKNKHILNQQRGGGYWLWKPYFILETLKKMNFGDYLFYSDSGAFFIKNIETLISEAKKNNQDIVAFELPLIEKQWTKRELFVNIDCDSAQYKDTNQVMATFQLIKKTESTIKFYEEYLEVSLDTINITDEFDNNISQDKMFIEHRHDQSIFSLLYKKYKFRPFKDPTQRAEFPSTYALSSNYSLKPNLLHSMPGGVLFRYYNYTENYKHVLYINRKQPPIRSIIKYILKRVLFRFGLYRDIIA